MAKSYIEKAKQFEEQYKDMQKAMHKKPKQYEKDEQFHHEPSMSHTPEEKPLTEWEVESLFWNRLVQLGWRLNNVDNNPLKSVQLMFTCLDCGKGLHTQQSHTVTPSRARAMFDTHWLNRVVQKHKTDTTRGCKPEYDENGEAISEA